jgi:hypothetical protein
MQGRTRSIGAPPPFDGEKIRTKIPKKYAFLAFIDKNDNKMHKFNIKFEKQFPAGEGGC